MKKLNIIFIIVIFLYLIIGKMNISYAGLFPWYQYIEIELKNYRDNEIVIKDNAGNILESNDNIKSDGMKIGEMTITKNNKIIIDAMGIEFNCVLNKVIIEITNNNGQVDKIVIGSCKNKAMQNQNNVYYMETKDDVTETCYLKYNCKTGKVTNSTFYKNNKISIYIIIILIYIIIVVLISMICAIKRKMKKEV